MIAAFILALQAQAADPLMTPGVSLELARKRTAQISDVRYTLTLDVRQRESAAGGIEIHFRRRGGGDVILDFRGPVLTIDAVNGVAVSGVEWNGHHARIPAAALRDSVNIVKVAFTTPIAPAGTPIIRFTDDTDKRAYLYTLLVPSDAHLLFPCFDQPDLKAVFTLSLFLPNDWKALSNGAGRQGIGDYADGRPGANVAWFEPTKPISTYLFAFAAGPYEQLRDAKGDITVWVRKSRAKEVEVDSLIALNRRAKDWLAQYFDVPYPFEKLDFLLAPAFPFGGMEHPGAVFYNEESMIYREPPTLTQLVGRRALINHEIAHQWFGDYTTMRWFDDLWLKEGFATYMAAKMSAAQGDESAWMSFYMRNKPSAYDVDASMGTTPIWQELANLDQAKSNYGAIVYNKAPGVLKQLEHLVGEDNFRRGVRLFLKKHAFGNATWRELLTAINMGAMASSVARQPVDLDDFGRSYFLRPGMPIVEQRVVTRDGRIDRLLLIQRPAQRSVSGPGPWPMRTDVRVKHGLLTRIFPVTLRAETTEVAEARGLPAPDLVYANESDYGYGLFMPDSASVRHFLSGDVRLDNNFSRAMLWGSLWDLVRAARLDPRQYSAAAIRDLPREYDEQIVSRLLGRVSRSVEDYFAPAADAESLFLRRASDTTLGYGLRKSHFDAYVGVARTRDGVRRLDAWLDSTTAAGMPLRQPSRWAIVTQLVTGGAPNAAARLAAETTRDTTTGGKRRAFIAGAGFASAEVKRTYFNRYFRDTTLNEDWATASLGAFNAAGQESLTLPYLRPALDTLPWIQANRRIFFLGSWLGSFIGGQNSAEALAVVDKYLAENPRLPRDLRLKVLQARDDLERTVRIRSTYRDR